MAGDWSWLFDFQRDLVSWACRRGRASIFANTGLGKTRMQLTYDVVLSPFMGIGSEGFVALEQSRRFVGVELKESYYRQAVKNLESATVEQGTLF